MRPAARRAAWEVVDGLRALGAEIVEVGEHGVDRGLAVEDTLAFRAMRDFLEDPHGIAEYMADWAEGELA